MIEQLSKHSQIDINIKANGDLHIDAHHTTEDIGYTIGKAISEALSERKEYKDLEVQMYLWMKHFLENSFGFIGKTFTWFGSFFHAN